MDRDDETISASELNRYAYCPYQWYYERLYGRKEINARYRERNAALGFSNATAGNFKRGLAFHRRYPSAERMRRLIKAAIVAAVIGCLLYCYFCLILILD